MGVSTTHSINLCMWILIYWHTLRLGCLWQNMHGFDHATILSPSFHGLCKERLTQWTPICIQLFREGLSEKVHATIPKGIVGGFECSDLQGNVKNWYGRPRTYVLRVLKESNKSMFDSYSRQEQCIDHIPYYLSGLSRAHFFSDNLSRNSCIKYDEKARGWCFQRNCVGDVLHVSWNPYPISDQNLWFSLPYFRPNQKFDTLFQIWSPGARRVNA